MPRKRTRPMLAAFQDCLKAMEAALKMNGARVECNTPGKATSFRHRCYKARAILYQAAVGATPPGMVPSTPYDDLYLIIEDTQVVFRRRSLDAQPTILTLDGTPPPEEPNFEGLNFE